MALARAATLLAALGATLAYATDIGYLAPPGVPAKEFPSPQRPVAQIVSPSRSAEEHRDSLNEAGDIARLLELKLGMTVGDIGAGGGYHTVRLSRLVGPAGTVIALDVTRDYLIELAKRTERLKLTNVMFALGEPHDPRLPASSLDAAILVHMYHEIAQPYAFLYNLAPALKCVANCSPLAITRSPHISSQAMADTWRCSLHRSKRVGNLPGISLPAGIVPALVDPKGEVRS